jgi:hypothetical protein
VRPPADPSACLDETAARRVLLLRACESDAVAPALWSPEDRAWATRLATETVLADMPPTRYLDERARQACERLLPRDATLARALRQRLWRPAWVGWALGLGLLAGIAADSLGGGLGINLLAPPLWGVLLWNLLVYAWLLVPGLRPSALPLGLRRGLGSFLAGGRAGPLPSFEADWVHRSAPLTSARAALLLHLAAAALALGLVAGLYLRGLVLDYRVAWQSTFLDAAAVRSMLALALAPASALTGIAVPDEAAMAALRSGPAAAATASAAPWIHLLAATLVLWIVLPRGALALAAAWTAARRARCIEVPLDEPYFQRLLHDWRRTASKVQLLAHGAPLSAQAALGLRAVLAAALGDGVVLRLAPATAYGDEDSAPGADPGTSLRLAVVDLAATPEAEAHGRFLAGLAAARLPVLLVADEAASRRRFAALPERLAERRALWQRLANDQGVGLVCIDLAAPDLPAATAAFEAALVR